ncbi:RimJ/RimL family protein N-acetyltransferase [Paucimonas lemoignei]|uniref:RimJ/RimL family protein N-acetyltransferase n=1 Tax=Paucimonas lemoignei TaxID=29443 RepID=A0A4R3HSV4_PAULE|nr:GNAT family N-acetyltransferase [Paucimonas lemoignei]TCS33713.1 RimJ/RimL family protein N-acetyltransferase [Paucimonas lemoignei]
MSDSFSLPTLLDGENIVLRPLAASDYESLYQVASDPLIWEQHPSRTRYLRSEFDPWFQLAVKSRSALIVIDRNSGSVIGTSRYYNWNKEKKEVAIGYTFIARAYWGGPTNAELKKLMLNFAFQTVDRVWFHVAVTNTRSRKAVEKIGGVFSHTGIENLSGGAQEYAFYRIDRPGVNHEPIA